MLAGPVLTRSSWRAGEPPPMALFTARFAVPDRGRLAGMEGSSPQAPSIPVAGRAVAHADGAGCWAPPQMSPSAVRTVVFRLTRHAAIVATRFPADSRGLRSAPFRGLSTNGLDEWQDRCGWTDSRTRREAGCTGGRAPTGCCTGPARGPCGHSRCCRLGRTCSPITPGVLSDLREPSSLMCGRFARPITRTQGLSDC